MNDCFGRRTRHGSGESSVEAVPDAATIQFFEVGEKTFAVDLHLSNRSFYGRGDGLLNARVNNAANGGACGVGEQRVLFGSGLCFRRSHGV